MSKPLALDVVKPSSVQGYLRSQINWKLAQDVPLDIMILLGLEECLYIRVSLHTLANKGLSHCQ